MSAAPGSICCATCRRGVTGEIHHVDAGYNVIGMKAEDAPDIARAREPGPAPLREREGPAA